MVVVYWLQVIDYSVLVALDYDKGEITVGIIDYVSCTMWLVVPTTAFLSSAWLDCVSHAYFNSVFGLRLFSRFDGLTGSVGLSLASNGGSRRRSRPSYNRSGAWCRAGVIAVSPFAVSGTVIVVAADLLFVPTQVSRAAVSSHGEIFCHRAS